MHIRFNSPIAGVNFAYQPGDVADWPDEKEAARMLERGIADELTPEAAADAAKNSGRTVRRHKPVETATRAQGERAVTR